MPNLSHTPISKRSRFHISPLNPSPISATSSSAFTLIELLIVFSIMALVLGLSIVNYRGFQDRQKLMSATRMVKGDLRVAQEHALGGVKPTGCVRLDGYRFSYVDCRTYEVSALCDGSSIGIPVKNVNISPSCTAPNIRFNSGFIPVIFNVLGRGVRSAVTITLRDNKTPPNTSQISITLGGEIY